MAKIRVELEGRPGSFFEAEVKGPALHVAFGPRDRIAQTKARPFPTEAAAQAELERLIALHRTKGYVDAVEAPKAENKISAKQATEDARARAEWLAARQEEASKPAQWKLVVDDELLATCEASDKKSSWHVYADRLAAGGDPRGELALGMLRGLTWEGDKALPEFLGPVSPLEVKHGFVRAAGVRGIDLPALKHFLATPFAASLRMLRVGLPELGDWTAALAAIGEAPAGRRLRELEFDASDRLVRDSAAYEAVVKNEAPDQDAYDDYRDANRAHTRFLENIDGEMRTALAAVSPVRFTAWPALPALERLVIDGPFRGDLGTLDLPLLSELVIRSDRFSNVIDLARAKCPKLETLEIWFGDQVWSGPDGELDPSPLFEPEVLPSLKTLRVFDAHEVTLALIQKSKLAKRVKLVTTPPKNERAARYAHPQHEERIPFKLPRDGEPPKPKAKAKPKKKSK